MRTIPSFIVIIFIGLTTSDKPTTGVYEYVYPYNSNDLSENHYLRLEQHNDTVTGIYYGTSDDFDDAREGYLPGFFMARMRDLIMTDSTIRFTVRVDSSDMFTKPITPFDNPKDNTPWTSGIRYRERAYTGGVAGDSIVIQTKGFKPRLFLKR